MDVFLNQINKMTHKLRFMFRLLKIVFPDEFNRINESASGVNYSLEREEWS